MKNKAVALLIVAFIAIGVFICGAMMGNPRSEAGLEGDALLAVESTEERGDDDFADTGPNDVIVALDTDDDGKFDSVEVRDVSESSQVSFALTYEDYQSMPGEEQEQWLNKFDSTESFFDWYNGAEAVHNANNEVIVIEDVATAELGVVVTENGEDGNL